MKEKLPQMLVKNVKGDFSQNVAIAPRYSIRVVAVGEKESKIHSIGPVAGESLSTRLGQQKGTAGVWVRGSFLLPGPMEASHLPPAEPGQRGAIFLHGYISKEWFPGSGERHCWVAEELPLGEAERTYNCHFTALVSCYQEAEIVLSTT